MAYGPANTEPMVKARMLNRTGQTMSELAITPAAIQGSSQVDVPLSGLAPGEYIVEISAGDGEAKELVGFRVTG